MTDYVTREDVLRLIREESSAWKGKGDDVAGALNALECVADNVRSLHSAPVSEEREECARKLEVDAAMNLELPAISHLQNTGRLELEAACLLHTPQAPVSEEQCSHDWRIWPETDGQEQRCSKCCAYRRTPREVLDAILHPTKPVSEEREAEMRQIIMSAVALGVAAERKGLYKGSAWAADAVMEEVTNLLRAPQQQAEPVVCCKDSDSNGLPMTLICNPKCRRVAAPQQQAEYANERRMHNVTIANLTAVEAELAAAQAEIAALKARPCPHIRTSGTTSYCELAEWGSAIHKEGE
jgi:hypothetical protein